MIMKKHLIKLIFLSVISVLLALAVTSCGKSELKVHFIVDGETYQTVIADGDRITMPNAPQKAEHSFDGWFVDAGKWKLPFGEDFLIGKGYEGDFYIYAKWTFIHDHVAGEWITVTEASCDKEGERIRNCTICGMTVDSEIIEKPPHKEVIVSGFPATDTRDGLTDGSYCSVCSSILAEQKLIPSTIQGTSISSDDFTLEGDMLFGYVSNSTEEINIKEHIKTHRKATLSVFLDGELKTIVTDETVKLATGDNTFYLSVTSGKQTKTYSLRIRRRPVCTVSFDTLGGDALEPISVEEGLSLAPPTPTRRGYTFVGWDIDFEKPVFSDMKAVASWKANDDTKYKVEHYIKNPDGKYTLYDTKLHTGTTDSSVNAEIIPIYGYGLNENIGTLTSIISPDGSLVLKAYYDRIFYTVSFDTDCEATLDSVTVDCGKTLAPPSPIKNNDAIFLGWHYNGSPWNFDTDRVNADITLVAVWTCVDEHTPGELTLEIHATCSHEGLEVIRCIHCNKILLENAIAALPHTEAIAEAIAPTDTSDGLTEGVYCSVCDTPIVPQESIPARIQGTDIESDYFKLSGTRFTVSLPNKTSAISIIDKLKFNTKATVKVYFDSTLENELTDDTVAISEGYNGFYIVIKSGDAHKMYTLTVQRNRMYTVKFKLGGGIPDETVRIEEGSTLTPPTPTRIGYTFIGWDRDFSLPVFDNITANALWSPNEDTKYTVEYYLENPGGTFFLTSKESYTGTTDTTVSAILKQFEGYILDEDMSETSAILTPDGALVLRLFYKLGSFIVSFDTQCGEKLDNVRIQKDGHIAMPEPLENGTATFLGWYYGDSLWDFENGTVTEHMTLVAKWKYKVVFTVNNEVWKTEYVISGEKLSKPEDPTSTLPFFGWYIKGTGLLWSFDSEVTKDLILEASFKPVLPEEEW